jgi:hypothetical protein
LGKMSRRRDERKEEAVERDESRAGRSPSEQLTLLDARLGDSMGAQRERLRLLRAIEESKPKKRSTKKQENKRSTEERGERRKAKDRRNDDRGRKG